MENKKNNLPTVLLGTLLFFSIISNINQQNEVKKLKSDISYCENKQNELERKVENLESEYEDCQNELEDCENHKKRAENYLQDLQYNNTFNQ